METESAENIEDINTAEITIGKVQFMELEKDITNVEMYVINVSPKYIIIYISLYYLYIIILQKQKG